MLGFLHQPSSCWDSFERCCAGGVGGGWLVGCVARCDAGSRPAHWNAETCGLARHRCVSLLWMDVMRTGWRSRVTLVKAYGFLATGVVRCILFYSGCFVFYMGLSKLSTVLQQAVSL